MQGCGHPSLKWPLEHAVGLSRLGREGDEMQIGGGSTRDIGDMGVAKGLAQEEDIWVAVPEPGFAQGGYVSCDEREGIRGDSGAGIPAAGSDCADRDGFA